MHRFAAPHATRIEPAPGSPTTCLQGFGGGEGGEVSFRLEAGALDSRVSGDPTHGSTAAGHGLRQRAQS
ncbi:hypothetical protein HUU62_19465 [Rhodoferax sp. 4810]|nr:hypothetical protein [Rhodoferax jenense]